MEERVREQVRISVRNLVEFILRSGDLDNRKDKTPDKNAMQAGAKMHRKIQNGWERNTMPKYRFGSF